MSFTEDTERFNDIDYVDPNDEPICVCEQYEGAVHPVYCRACMMWTDDKELLMAEAAEIAEVA